MGEAGLAFTRGPAELTIVEAMLEKNLEGGLVKNAAGAEGLTVSQIDRYDVTMSVWGGFHVRPLAKGLVDAGYSVLGLGTTRRGFSARDYRICVTSALLTQMIYRLPWTPSWFLDRALTSFESFAERHAGNSRIFWGWSNHHLRAFEKAKAAGATIVLESGSSHGEWQRDRMYEEYRRCDCMSRSRIDESRVARSVREYSIADKICVPSRFVAETFLERGVDPEKIFVNSYGVDSEVWRAVAEERGAEQPDGPFVFVFTGSVMLRKGMDHLLRAWEALGAKDAELWLVGGIYPDCRGRMGRLPRGVKVLGFQPWDNLREVYLKADVYMLPSLEEGMARSVLEAMAAGLPVIVTRETGTTEVIVDGEDGWVVEAANAEALVEAMREAIDSRGRLRAMGQRARARVLPMTWEAYGERAAGLLEGLIGKAG